MLNKQNLTCEFVGELRLNLGILCVVHSVNSTHSVHTVEHFHLGGVENFEAKRKFRQRGVLCERVGRPVRVA